MLLGVTATQVALNHPFEVRILEEQLPFTEDRECLDGRWCGKVRKRSRKPYQVLPEGSIPSSFAPMDWLSMVLMRFAKPL